jgi:hypothetical protein
MFFSSSSSSSSHFTCSCSYSFVFIHVLFVGKKPAELFNTEKSSVGFYLQPLFFSSSSSSYFCSQVLVVGNKSNELLPASKVAQ